MCSSPTSRCRPKMATRCYATCATSAMGATCRLSRSVRMAGQRIRPEPLEQASACTWPNPFVHHSSSHAWSKSCARRSSQWSPQVLPEPFSRSNSAPKVSVGSERSTKLQPVSPGRGDIHDLHRFVCDVVDPVFPVPHLLILPLSNQPDLVMSRAEDGGSDDAFINPILRHAEEHEVRLRIDLDRNGAQGLRSRESGS